eukprot:TRINITY_DN13690_c0_g1_i1.p1 TRINITY_DN13690_c0_g1~~TRINITY_DN13690_c0_g1_i1.p1  ORF type:complete len:191 (-),score=21.77 TRINITY_DN13690_c0_g1_i1:726-1298(-)
MVRNGSIPMPARTLLQKLSVAEAPAWATYLPAGMQEQLSEKRHGHFSSEKEPTYVQTSLFEPPPCAFFFDWRDLGNNRILKGAANCSEPLSRLWKEILIQNYLNLWDVSLWVMLPSQCGVPTLIMFCNCTPRSLDLRSFNSSLMSCFPVQAEELAEAILGATLDLGRNPYGNYVLQNLLEHGMSGFVQSK